MSGFPRLLSGLVVNVSISESDDSDALGFPKWQVNRVTLELAAALLGQGAAVSFGHDWREDGVMQAVYGYARQVRSPATSTDQNTAPALMWNLLPWPDRTSLGPAELEEIRPLLRVENVGLPTSLQEPAEGAAAGGPASELHRYCRARGLTHLRHRLNEVSHARVCVGGRTSGFGGRYPGVVEEALLATRVGKPLYLVGLLGGAASQVIAATNEGTGPQPLQSDPLMRALYAAPPAEEVGGDGRDRVYQPEDLWNEFKEAGPRIRTTNGLSEEENAELAGTHAVDRAIHLVLRGLGKVKSDGAGNQDHQ